MMRASESTEGLDGNAAAGVLSDLFAFEPSRAEVVCGGCGAVAPIGRLAAYALEMGAVLRCRECDTALLCIGVTGRTRSLVMRGAAVLRYRVGDSPSSPSRSRA
jgi:hypothetical protein